MNRPAALLILLGLLLAGCGGGEPVNAPVNAPPAPAKIALTEFASTAGNFTVLMPDGAHEVTEEIDTPLGKTAERTVRARLPTGGAEISYREIPGKVVREDGIDAEYALLRLLVEEDATMLEMWRLRIVGFNGTAATVRTKNGTEAKFRAVRIGTRLYMMMVEYLPAQARVADEILSSFRCDQAFLDANRKYESLDAPVNVPHEIKGSTYWKKGEPVDVIIAVEGASTSPAVFGTRLMIVDEKLPPGVKAEVDLEKCTVSLTGKPTRSSGPAWIRLKRMADTWDSTRFETRTEAQFFNVWFHLG